MKKRTFKSVFIMLLTLVCMFVMPVMSASADETGTADAQKRLEQAIEDGKVDPNGAGGLDVSKNTYELQGGGTIAYGDVVGPPSGVENSTFKKGYVNSNFTKLTSKSQEKLLTDMNSVADGVVEDTGSSNAIVSDQTKTNWLTNLQQYNGVGTQLMNSILQNTKPDYATANRIYEPFSGIVGTCLALGAILIMAFLGITMVLDLSYIGIPAFRMMVGGDDKGGKDGKPKFISWEAVSAVTQAEGGNGGSGQDGSSNKVAVGIYFKKRVIMLIVLGVCLLYLISGQIYTLVSWILDLVSGFLGF